MIAIYTRQSVDKKDSISIETQTEACKNKILPADMKDIKVFEDRGVSGKSTDREEFQNMMTEVRNKNVSKIIVYKIDRISRSLLDFITMRKDFEEYGVEFISCSEDFDTSTSMGKLILNVLMMFAEMERETIQQRIKDNYYARGEKGFYLGGYAPFGYKKIDTSIEGKETYMFEENKEESPILKQMFNDYLDGKSIGDIARSLNHRKIPTRKKKAWANPAIARILRSPVYVKANADVYNYLLGLGAKMNNDIDDYIGKNGCFVYGNAEERKTMKFADLSTDFVTLGLHEGIIEPSLWLGVQYIINQKKDHSNLGTGSLTWLQGLVKCKCGYTYYVKKCKSGKRKTELRYFYCRGRRNDSCPYARDMTRVERVEEIVEIELISHLNNLKKIDFNKINADNPELNFLKIQKSKIDEQIDNVLKLARDGSEITINYLNQEIEKLHGERQTVINEINDIQLKVNRNSEMDIDIDEVINNWFDYEIEAKKVVAKKIIQKIILEGEEINIIFY